MVWSDAVEHPSYVRIHSSRFSTSGLPLLSLLNWIGLRDLGRLDHAQWSGPLVSQYNRSQCVFFIVLVLYQLLGFIEIYNPRSSSCITYCMSTCGTRLWSSHFFSLTSISDCRQLCHLLRMSCSHDQCMTHDPAVKPAPQCTVEMLQLWLCLMDRKSKTPNGESCHHSNPIQPLLTLSSNLMN